MENLLRSYVSRTERITWACARLNVSKATLLKMKGKDVSLPIYKTSTGLWLVDVDALEAWISDQRNKKLASHRSMHAGRAGVYEQPQADAIREAAEDLRFIALEGAEPPHSQYWRNAARLLGDVPADITVAFDLQTTAGWNVVVDQAERLLALPPPKRKLALEYVTKRLQAHHDETTGGSL